MRKATQPVGDHLETAVAPFHLFLEFMWLPFLPPKSSRNEAPVLCPISPSPPSPGVGVRKKETSKLSLVELLLVLNMRRQPQSMLGDRSTTAQTG